MTELRHLAINSAPEVALGGWRNGDADHSATATSPNSAAEASSGFFGTTLTL